MLPNERPWRQPAYQGIGCSGFPKHFQDSFSRHLHSCSLLAVYRACLLAQELGSALVRVKDGGSTGLRGNTSSGENESKTGAKEAAPANNFRSFPLL